MRICCDTFRLALIANGSLITGFAASAIFIDSRFFWLLFFGMQSDFFWLGRLLRLCQNIPEVHEELMLGANLQVA